MSLFSRKGKKAKKNAPTPLTDILTMRMVLSDDFDPANNPEVQGVLDKVSANEANRDGVTPIKESWPFATFATAEDFLGELQSKIAENNTEVDFKEFAVYQYNPDEKYNPNGKSNGNPRMMISVPDFKLTYAYQNLTKVLFEEIFNDEANDEVSYDDKVAYCNQIADAYKDSTNGSDQDIARIPSLDETNHGRVELDVPIFAQDDLFETNDTNNSAETASSPLIYDSATGQFIVPEQTVTVPMPDSVSATTTSEQAPTTVANEPAQSVSPVAASSNANSNDESLLDQNQALTDRITAIGNEEDVAVTSRSQRRELNDDIEAQDDEAESITQVTAPQFEIQDLPAREVGEGGYVEYYLNERKKYYNQRLNDVASFLSESNAKLIIKKREEYQRLIKQAAAKYVQEHSEALATIQDDVNDRMATAKNRAMEVEDKKLQASEEAALNEAERNYKQTVDRIKADTRANRANIDSRLTKEYNEKAQQEYDQTYNTTLKSIDEGASEVTAEKEREYEIKAREDVTTLSIEASDRMQRMIDEAKDALETYETQLVQNQLNGQQTRAAVQRAANEKRRIEAPYAELHHRAEELNAKDKLLAQTQAERDALQKEVTGMKQDLEQQKRRYDTLVNNKLDDSKLKAAEQVEQVTKKATIKEDNFDKLVNLQLANLLDEKHDQVNRDNRQDEQVTALQKQLLNVNWGAKRAVYGLGAILILGGIGGGYTIYHQNQTAQQRIQAAQARATKATKENEAVKATKSLTPSEVNDKATTALHEVNAKQLAKYQTETYYDLDKAIIAKDANAANQAVQKLANLDLHDSYRATQTETLLKQANNNDLAQKVADANK